MTLTKKEFWDKIDNNQYALLPKDKIIDNQTKVQYMILVVGNMVEMKEC